MGQPRTVVGRTVAAWALGASLVAALPARAAGETAGPGKASRTFRVVELEGTPRERGLKHGRELREEIRGAVATWKEILRDTYQADPDLFIKQFLARTNYVPAVRKWTPGLLEEVQGISEGAGIDFPTMFAYQLVDEYWVNGGETLSERCSGIGIAATADHPAIVAQNTDLEGFRDGLQTLLHVRESSGLEAYVLTVPGLVAGNGMNSRGVGIATNTLSQLAHDREGLPVAFVVRGVLQRGTFDEVESFLNAVPHASGQNYIVGGNGRVALFEAAAGKVVEITCGAGFAYHTNHPLANDRTSKEGAEEMRQPNPGDSTRTRYASLKRRLSAEPGTKALEVVAETLRSRDSETYPVCRRLKGRGTAAYTFASTIMVLTGPQPTLMAAPGPPDEYEYARFRFGAPAAGK